MEFFLAAWVGFVTTTYLRAVWGSLCVVLFVVALDSIILRDIDFFPFSVVMALWTAMAAKALTGALLAQVVRRLLIGRQQRAAAALARQQQEAAQMVEPLAPTSPHES